MLEKTLEQIKSGGIGDTYGRWRTQLAVVKAALGKTDEVEKLLREAEPWLTRSSNERAVLRTRTYRARIRLKQGNLAEAAQWAERCQTLMGQPFRQDLEDNTLARVWISQGKVLEALQLLESRAPALQEKKILLFLIENLALQAVALQRLGHQAEAFETVQQALRLAETENLQRVLIDLGYELALLLARLMPSLPAADSLQAFAGQILAGFPAQDRAAIPTVEPRQGAPSAGKEEWVESLSEREVEVLRWMARGLSNLQIADQMVVAESTVKKHINHIFGKLAVENRTQALIKARERGLL
jgi:LuxR family maltose regulon positive regulatory protein